MTTRKKPAHFLMGIGSFLIMVALAVLVYWQHGISESEAMVRKYAGMLQELMPERRFCVPEPRDNNDMPALCVEGHDFVALLEIPVCDRMLPVEASQSADHAFPKRYDGSIYDGSLVIGATDQRGQMDFVKQIAVGDITYLTDMTGARFSLVISDIRYVKTIRDAILCAEARELMVFIKNEYSLSYTLLLCSSFS